MTSLPIIKISTNRWAYEEKIAKHTSVEMKCLRQVKDLIKFFMKQRAFKCGKYFCVHFSPFAMPEYWFLQTAPYWLRKIPIDSIKITRLGVNDEREISTIGISIPLHEFAPHLYIIPCKRFLHMIWSSSGFLLYADVNEEESVSISHNDILL